MKNFDLKNVDCHATLGMIEKRWGFPRRTLRALLGMTKNAQSGRSMIEMLGVLAIIGVLSVGGIAGYSKAMQKYRINKTIEQITLIAGNVRTFFAGQGNYAGLNTNDDTGKAIVKKAKLVPDEMLELNENGSIKQINNAFGGEVGLRHNDWLGHDGFYIAIGSLPQQACIEIVTQDWKSVSSVKAIIISSYGAVGYYAMTKGVSVTQCPDYDNIFCSDSETRAIPLNIDQATTVCSDNIGIGFVFY